MGKSKVAFAALCYCLFMTGIFVSGIFYVQHYLNSNQPTSTLLIYKAADIDFKNNYNDGKLTLTLDNTVSGSEVLEQYNEKVQFSLISFAAVCFCFLFISIIVLGIIWYRLDRAELQKTVSQFQDLTNEKEMESYELWIRSVFYAVKGIFDDNLNSYKRLHSYLSHEQKNQIAILRANVEMEDNKPHLKVLDSLSDSIDDILTLSENEDNRQHAEMDAALVCAEVCDNYKNAGDITFSFSEDMNTYIYAKERWIYRAVSNLVDNAIKYGNGKGIKVNVVNHNNSVIISVEDQGIGISKEQMQRIFEHKYRVDELNRNGYGIGLSVVSHVCDLCGGFVYAESEPQQWSKFYLSFPEAVNN